MSDDQILLFKEKEALLGAAQKQADAVDQVFGSAIKLYFIARYFVAVHESRYGAIPIQVWNEYRNALDHFFRHLTTQATSQEKAPSHLSKMEGHLQRAALDILKLICHNSRDAAKAEVTQHQIAVLQLVDNGEFYRWLTQANHRAEELFTQAKVSDIQLGEDAKLNADILNMYLDAAFAADEIIYKLIQKSGDIQAAQQRHDGIAGKARHLSWKDHYIVHATFYVAAFLFGALVWHPVVAWAKGTWKTHNTQLVQAQTEIKKADQPDVPSAVKESENTPQPKISPPPP